MWPKFQVYETVKKKISSGTSAITAAMYNRFVEPLIPYGTQKTLDLIGNYGAFLLKPPYQPYVKSLIRNCVGKQDADLQKVLGFTPELVKTEYSKLIRGFRYALTNMLNGEKIPNHELGDRWRVYVIPLAEFMDSILDPQKSFAYVDKNINVINLPELRFSKELTRQYFCTIDDKRLFQDIDNAACPKWVIRIKKIWNLLFLVEKILNAIETNPHQILTQELLSDINHAYTLLFELDIDVFAIFQKYTEKLIQISQKTLQGQVMPTDELSIAKDLGYYLGLTLSQLGSSGNLVSFIFQNMEFLPHLLAKVTDVLQNMVDLATQKGSLSLEIKNIEEINQEAKKIKNDIEKFFRLQQEGKANAFQIVFDIIELLSNSKDVNLSKFFNYIGHEHQALCKEFLRLVKYELVPSLLGVIEEFENTMLLEPGSMVFYLEGMAQSYYGVLIDFLKYESENDLKRLYSAHWMKIREYNGLKRLSALLQQESLIESKLVLLGMTYALKNLTLDEFAQIKAKVLQLSNVEYVVLREKFESLNDTNYQHCLFEQTEANLLVHGLNEDSRLIANLIIKETSYQEFEQLRFRILALVETPENLKNKLRYLNADNFQEAAFARKEFNFLQPKMKADNQIFSKLTFISREVSPFEQFKNLYDYFVLADSLVSEKIRKSESVVGPEWDTIRQKVSMLLQSEFLQVQNQITFLRKYIADFECAQHQRIAYFELPYDFEIKKENLSAETQAAIDSASPQAQEGLLKQALLEEKKRQLYDCICSEKYQEFFVGQVAVIKFLDEYFVVPKNSLEQIREIDPISLPMKPLKDRAIILPGLTVQQLGYHTRVDTFVVQISQELPRFSLELSKKHVTLDQLSIKDLNAYQIELFEQAEKIKIAKIHVANLRLTLQNPKTAGFINQLLHEYYNLQGVFQYFLEERFIKFNSQIIGQKFRHLSKKLRDLEGFLDGKADASTREIYSVGQEIQKKLVSEKQRQYEKLTEDQREIQKKLVSEKQRQYEKLTEDQRAGYLLHHTRYSSFFREYIEKLKSYVEQYGSASLKQALIKTQKESSDSALIYDSKQLFNVDKINQKGFEICYAHNCLLYLEQLYLGFEKQRRYDVNNTKAISEIMIRVNSIVDLLKFVDFASSQKFKTAIFKSFNHLFHYQTTLQTFNRYSRIYGLRDIQAYPVLNTALIAHKAITDVFEKPEIRDYIFRGALTQEIQRRTDMIMANRQSILAQFNEAQKTSSYQAHKEEIRLLRSRILGQVIQLKQLASSLERRKTPFKAIQYAIQNKLLHQLNKKLSQEEVEFDLILENRNQLFFRIMEKKRQKRTAELSEIEQVILKLMSDNDLSTEDKKLIKKTIQKRLKLIEQRKVFSDYYRELGKKTSKLKEVFKPLYLQYISISQKLKQRPLTLLESLIKDAYEQASTAKNVQLNSEKINYLREIFQKTEAELSADELTVKNLFKQNSTTGSLEFRYPGLSEEEAFFKKIYFRHINGYPFELNPKDKRLIDSIINKPGLARIPQEVKIIQLINVHEKKYTLVSYQSNFKEDLLLELHQKRINCGFVRWSELTDEDLLKLPQITNIFLRSDIQKLFRNFKAKKTEQNLEKLMAAIQETLSASLQEFEVLDFRVKELKEQHLLSKQVINDYTLIQQGYSSWGFRYVTVYPILISRLRQSLVQLRKNSALRVGDLREYIITPFISNIDKFEIELGLRPGLLSNLIERQLLAFSYEFSGELSASSLYIPRRLRDDKTALQIRRDALQATPDAEEASAILQESCQIACEEEERKFKEMIFDTFKKSSHRYCKLLRTGFNFLSDEQALGVISNLMEKEVTRQIASVTNLSELKDEIYNEIARQGDEGHRTYFPSDAVFQRYFASYTTKYMADKQHELKKVDDLFKTLKDYKDYLQGIQKDLNHIEKELIINTETWAAYFYKFGLQIEYYFKIKIYYASLSKALIDEKIAQISVLETKLNETFEDIDALTNAFKATFNDTSMQQTLSANQRSKWYPTYYICYLMYSLLKCVISLINVFYPEIQVMDKYQLFNKKLKNSLNLKKGDVAFDVKSSLNTFFAQPTEHSSATREALRRK